MKEKRINKEEIRKIDELFRYFKRRELAEFIFNVVEDGRIDYKNRIEFPGFELDYQRLIDSELQRRPTIEGISLGSIAEAFIQLVIAGKTKNPIPPDLERIVQPLVKIARSVQRKDAGVEDSFNATIEIYKRLLDLERDGIDLQSRSTESIKCEEEKKEEKREPKESNSESSNGEKNEEKKKEKEREGVENPESEKDYGKSEESINENKKNKEDRSEEEIEKEESEGIEQNEERSDESDEDEDEEVNDSQGNLEGDLKGERKKIKINLNEFMIPKNFSHHGENKWENAKVAQNGKELKQMKEEDEAKAKAEEEKKRKEKIEIEKAVARMKEGEETKGERLDWKIATNIKQQYHEYDFEKAEYIHRKSIVVEKTLNVDEWKDEEIMSVVNKVKRLFEKLKPKENYILKKQYDGEELDVDAYIQYLIEKKCGQSPEPKYFTRTIKNSRSIATLVLVDLSGSTRHNVTQNKRVIDIEKEALFVIAHALKAVGDIFSLCGFDSTDGVNVTNFYTFKSFKTTEIRIPNINPMSENRDGAAIRHATQKLLQTNARIKLLMVLSDGQPLHGGTYYVGDYAIKDTEKAIEEARAEGIKPFGIVVGKQSKNAFERMYGRDFIIIKNVIELPDLLPVIYRRLTGI